MTRLLGDARYTVRKEFTGDADKRPGLMLGQRWVVRFCGEWVQTVEDKAEGLQVVAAHQSSREKRAVDQVFARQ